jgi:hypothetical protein
MAMMPAMRPYGAVWRRKSSGAVAVCVHDARVAFTEEEMKGRDMQRARVEPLMVAGD